MKKTGRILSVLLCAVLLLSLCACGSNARKSDNGSGYTTASYSGQTYSYSYDYDDVAVADEAYGGFAASGLYESAAQASSSGTASNGSSGSAGSGEAEDLNPEKIIYSADKIEPGRENITPEYLNHLFSLDLNSLTKEVLQESMDYVSKKGGSVALESIEFLKSLNQGGIGVI